MADKIAVLRQGEVEQFGVPLDLYNRPRNLFVAGFIGSPKMNFLAGRVDDANRGVLVLPTGEQVAIPEDGFEQRPGQEVTLGIRPTVLQPDANGSVHIQVRTVEQLGGESYIYGETSDGTKLTVHSAGQTEVRLGETISLGMPPSQIHLFDTQSTLSLRAE